MKRWKFLAAITIVISAASLAACGGSSSTPSPASPSAPTDSGSSGAVTGATITGTVQGLATSAGRVSARDVVTVTVTGTTITATVDSQGTFVLKGVPAGTVTLTFSGTSATVTLQNVGNSGQIKIVVVISGGTATLETEQRVVDGQAQLEGRISSIVAPNFYVGDTLVTVGSAPIRNGDNATVAFTVLKVGDRVHVTGIATGTGTATPGVTASLITVQNTNPNVPVNLKGTIRLVSKACPVSEFVVEGYTVKTSGSTKFEKGECSAALVSGAEVHVKGDVVPAAGSVAAYVQATWVQFSK